MEDNRKFELNDDALNEVAGGRTGFDFGSPAGNTGINPDRMHNGLLQLQPDSEEDENTSINPGAVGHL